MAVYTATQIRAYTSVPEVKTWDDDTKVLLYQTMAEAVLSGLSLDTSVDGYTDAYNASVILLIDWLAQNPTGMKEMQKGKVKFIFDDLPFTVQAILRKAIEGSGDDSGGLESTDIERMDIGRR